MKYQGKLTNASPKHNNLRTTDVDVTFNDLPTIGSSFRCVGKPLDPKMDLRFIETSFIIEVEVSGREHKFKTETGSTYLLTIGLPDGSV